MKIEKIKIENDVEIPRKRTKKNYPFDLLRPGESFLVRVKYGKDAEKRLLNALKSTARKKEEKGLKEFVVWKVDGGVRVGRIDAGDEWEGEDFDQDEGEGDEV